MISPSAFKQEAAARGAKGNIDILPICLIKHPAVAVVLPPVDILIMVFLRIVKEMKTKDQRSLPRPVSVLEAVIDVVSNRLRSNLDLTSSSPTDLLTNIQKFAEEYRSAICLLLPKMSADAGRLATLIHRGSEIEEYHKQVDSTKHSLCSIIQAADANNTVSSPWNGWRHPSTVGWLMQGGLHNVEGLKNLYSSTDEYSECLLRLWVLLTFYWGSGALWPRCMFRKGMRDGSPEHCNEPLLQQTAAGTCRSTFKGERCHGTASWSCPRHGHDHICTSCLRKEQDIISGPPGPRASTDVYDAVVDREVTWRDETLYLVSSLRSRRPPRVDPKWKTTYRLPVSVLVGVCRLSVSGEGIPRSRPIEWYHRAIR